MRRRRRRRQQVAVQTTKAVATATAVAVAVAVAGSTCPRRPQPRMRRKSLPKKKKQDLRRQGGDQEHRLQCRRQPPRPGERLETVTATAVTVVMTAAILTFEFSIKSACQGRAPEEMQYNLVAKKGQEM